MLLADRMSFVVAVDAEPGVACDVIGRKRIVEPAEPKEIRALSATAVLPFGFGWQPVFAFGFIVQLDNELLDILPTDRFDREIISLKSSWILAHHLFPLSLSDFESSEKKRFGDGHA